MLFAGLALATGGVAAMPMGAVLMNYMGHYVGALAASSRAAGADDGRWRWHPWAVIRVISFAVIGVVSVGAAAVAAGIDSRSTGRARPARCFSAPCAGLAADIVLKTLLAPAWQRLLLRVVNP